MEIHITMLLICLKNTLLATFGLHEAVGLTVLLTGLLLGEVLFGGNLLRVYSIKENRNLLSPTESWERSRPLLYIKGIRAPF